MSEKVVKTCPITGLRIITKPEWENIKCNEGYSVSYKIIGGNILHGEGVGKGTIEGLIESLGLALKIIKENFKDKHFVYMENFEKIINPTYEARKYYTNFMKNLNKENMKALIFYNVSPYLSFNIKLVKKLNISPFPVFLVKNYSEAIEFATKILKTKDMFPKRNKTKQRVIREPEWKLETDDFSVVFEIINNNILHIIPSGLFKKNSVDPVFAITEKIVKAHFTDKIGNYHIVVNYGNFQTNRESKKYYLTKLNKFYDKYPFKSYVFYNISNRLNIFLYLSSAFIRFPIKREKDLNSALKYISTDKILKSKKVNFFKKGRLSQDIQIYVDEFLQFLGEIDWEEIGIDDKYKKDDSHPFYQIYEAIAIIKADLDDLYLQKKKEEEEKAILEYKLHQSLKLEAIGKLASAVAHDLNNVLMGIVSYPDYVLKLLPDNKENEKIRKYIRNMKESGIRAANIVQDLLTLSGKGVKSLKILNINSIIEEYLNSPEFKDLMKRYPKIMVKTNLDKNLYNILGSKIHLYKTIMNLVKNGFEAIKDKGRINITTKNKKFKNKKIKEYATPLKGDFIELVISDNGTGISEQDLPKIFEPFYSKKVMGRSGTGLGMMVVKGTVDDHNGAIEVRSKEDECSEFRIYFPAEKKDIKEKTMENIDNITGKREKILIVDDEEEQRTIAYEILRDLHYTVETVSSGEEALEYIKGEDVDLVLLDMIMVSGIGGLETYKRIKKIKPDLKTIIVSGYSAKDHVLEAQKLGVKRYIRKPYTIETIGKAVYDTLNGE